MGKKKFKLFMGCLGNGVTVCNSAVEENGDYKFIAHISTAGIIRWRVQPKNYCPPEALEKIERTAEEMRNEFREAWDRNSTVQKYGKMLDRLPLRYWDDLMDKKKPLEERVAAMEETYFEFC